MMVKPMKTLELKVGNFEANERYRIQKKKLGPSDTPALLSHLANLLRCQRGSLVQKPIFRMRVSKGKNAR